MNSLDDSNADTAELVLESREDVFVHEAGSLMAVDIAAATHQGNVRLNNEDHYLVMRFQRSLEYLYTNLTEASRGYGLTGYAMLVADGLGGMAAGEIASRLAIKKLVELVEETPDWIMGFTERHHEAVVLARMQDRFFRIDEDLKDRADRDVSLSGMGTTLTAAAVLGHDLILGHVGDSRAYLLRDDHLAQLTKDYTVAQAMIDDGVAKPGDPGARAMQHVLTAALGSLSMRTMPEGRRLRVEINDQLLLCTDGLTQMVDDTTIASILRNADSAEKACQDLITVALAAGGKDNVTAIVVRFGPSAD